MDGIRGVEVHYYGICHRKLWLFNKGIQFENDGHDRVAAGKVIHETSYSRMDQEVSPDDDVRIDRQDGDVLREIKLTSKMQSADRLQMLYYLYILKGKGVIRTGILSYPTEKKTVEVILDERGEQQVEEAIANIKQIVGGDVPELKKLPYCGKCAYKDFCFSGEVE